MQAAPHEKVEKNVTSSVNEPLLDPEPGDCRVARDTPAGQEGSCFHPEADGLVDSPQQSTAQGTFQSTLLIMLGDMLGLGTLSLPAAFARLGWALALGVLSLCALGSLFCGRMFALLAQQVPGAHVFDDFGSAALGRTGRYLVYAMVYTTIAGEPVIFHLTSMEALRQVFFKARLSPLAAGGLVAAIMLPLGQVQGVEEVSAAAVVGIVGMLVAIAITLGQLAFLAPTASATEWVHRPARASTTLVAVMDIAFAFGGQVNWTRYLMAMGAPRRFPYVVAATTGVMLACYTGVGALGYSRLGRDFDHDQPITSVLPQDAWSRVANCGLFAHCILAYMINLNIWTHLVLHLAAPRFLRPAVAKAYSGRAAWGLVSCLGVAYSFMVAVSFPFFSTIMAIIASLGDVAGAYALPALFVVVLVGGRLSALERVLLYCIIPLTVALSALGCLSSVRALAAQCTRSQ